MFIFAKIAHRRQLMGVLGKGELGHSLVRRKKRKYRTPIDWQTYGLADISIGGRRCVWIQADLEVGCPEITLRAHAMVIYISGMGRDGNKHERNVLRFYYVDEAGDPVLFSDKGRVIVGKEGCSKFFILGMLDVVAPDDVANAINKLRQQLLADPYFANVPSMRPEKRKTARLFHAKDDLPEVRREVFKLLGDMDLRFYAFIRDKRVIAEKVLAHNKVKPTYRYHPNQLYDRCVPMLFQERLHQHAAYRVVFAKRGSKDRTQAFERGLEQARSRFRQKRRIEGTAPIELVASDSERVTCLQATDCGRFSVVSNAVNVGISTYFGRRSGLLSIGMTRRRRTLASTTLARTRFQRTSGRWKHKNDRRV